MASPYAVKLQPFAGKVITVTGGSRGTGLALCKYLLARGATVSACATSADNLAKATLEIEHAFPEAKDRFWTKVVDIAQISMVKEWIDETVAKFGKLDGCANVAGETRFSHEPTLLRNMLTADPNSRRAARDLPYHRPGSRVLC
jgi:NAD(P)-dependent dehydrogenase (short-subunit alcohol dehydrogenase family)